MQPCNHLESISPEFILTCEKHSSMTQGVVPVKSAKIKIHCQRLKYIAKYLRKIIVLHIDFCNTW